MILLKANVIDISAARWNMSTALLKNPFYVNIIPDSSNLKRYYYGGNQIWFKGKIKTHGCGIIAATDMIIYLCRKHQIHDFHDIIDKNISIDDYKDFLNEMYKPFKKGFMYHLIGLSPRKVIDYIKQNCPLQNIRFKFCLTDKMGKASLHKYICDMLNEDIPVITRIGYNFKNLKAQMTNSAANTIKESSINWHYITITQMHSDLERGTTAVIFSSWGKIGNMSFDDFYEHLGFTGGIFIAEYT